MINHKRIVWVDNIKGILLFLTSSVHIMNRPWPISLLYSPTQTYYVPLFVVLSGYLCKPLHANLSKWGGYKLLLIKRVKTLIVPYLFFSIIAFIHGIILDHDVVGMLIQVFYSGFACGAAAPMWFVSMLFVTSVTFTWITWSKKLSHIYSIALIVVALSVLWLLVKDVIFNHPHKIEPFLGGGFPWHLRELPYWGALFLSGYLIQRVEMLFKKNSDNNSWSRIVVISLILIIMTVIGVGGLFMPIKNTIWAIVCPICLMSVIVYLIKYKPYSVLNQSFRSLHFISFNAIVILGTHVFLYGYIQHVLKQYVFFQNQWVNYFVNLILISLILYFIVVPFMNRYMYRFVGKTVPE